MWSCIRSKPAAILHKEVNTFGCFCKINLWTSVVHLTIYLPIRRYQRMARWVVSGGLVLFYCHFSKTKTSFRDYKEYLNGHLLWQFTDATLGNGYWQVSSHAGFPTQHLAIYSPPWNEDINVDQLPKPNCPWEVT